MIHLYSACYVRSLGILVLTVENISVRETRDTQGTPGMTPCENSRIWDQNSISWKEE